MIHLKTIRHEKIKIKRVFLGQINLIGRFVVRTLEKHLNYIDLF